MSPQRLAFALGISSALVMPMVARAPGPQPIESIASRVMAADSMRDPIVISSVPVSVKGKTIGILDARMEVVLDTVTPPGAPGLQVLRAYRLTWANGKTYNVKGFPGPTFRVHPGDSVRIFLTNKLAAGTDPHTCMSYPATQANPPLDTFPNCFHGTNSTNIHYHGMHVTPSGSGDNVLLEIMPGTSFQFAYRIPLNQSPGTHWYHPHKHGAVALQVTNGMSGALVVEGGSLDSLTQSLKMRQHLVAIQTIDSMVNLVGTTPGSVKLVNGQLNPVIYMRPNEVQRWRLVNENVSNTTTFTVLFAPVAGKPSPSLFDIARDGVPFAPGNYDGIHPDTNLIVAPGNRLDMFVRAPADTGLHQFNAVLTHQPGAKTELPGVQGTVAAAQPLLTVHVIADGTRPNTVLPKTLPRLPAFLANLPATPDTAQSIVFSETGKPGSSKNTPPSFFLGRADNPQMKFDPSTVFITMPLGAVQTWKVTNLSAVINHPFHIHINPFQVMFVSYLATDGNAPLYAQMNAAAKSGNPIWMDTFALPKSGYIVIRQQYEDFTGQFVTHCHILGHEERGMMQLLEIANPMKAR